MEKARFNASITIWPHQRIAKKISEDKVLIPLLEGSEEASKIMSAFLYYIFILLYV